MISQFNLLRRGILAVLAAALSCEMALGFCEAANTDRTPQIFAQAVINSYIEEGPQPVLECLDEELDEPSIAMILQVLSTDVRGLGDSFDDYASELLSSMVSEHGEIALKNRPIILEVIHIYALLHGIEGAPRQKFESFLPRLKASNSFSVSLGWYEYRAAISSTPSKDSLFGNDVFLWPKLKNFNDEATLNETEKKFTTASNFLTVFANENEASIDDLRSVLEEDLEKIEGYFGDKEFLEVSDANFWNLANSSMQFFSKLQKWHGSVNKLRSSKLITDEKWPRYYSIIKKVYETYHNIPIEHQMEELTLNSLRSLIDTQKLSKTSDFFYETVFDDENDLLRPFIKIFREKSKKQYKVTPTMLISHWNEVLKNSYDQHSHSLLPFFFASAMETIKPKVRTDFAISYFNEALYGFYENFAQNDALSCLVEKNNDRSVHYEDNPIWGILTEPCAPLRSILKGAIKPIILAHHKENLPSVGLYFVSGSHEALRIIDETVKEGFLASTYDLRDDFFHIDRRNRLDDLLCYAVVADPVFRDSFANFNFEVDIETPNSEDHRKSYEILGSSLFGIARLASLYSDQMSYDDMSNAIFSTRTRASFRCDIHIKDKIIQDLIDDPNYHFFYQDETELTNFVASVYRELWAGNGLFAPMWKWKVSNF